MLKDTEKKLHDRGKKVRAYCRVAYSSAHLDDCQVSRATVQLAICTHRPNRFGRKGPLNLSLDVGLALSQLSRCARQSVELNNSRSDNIKQQITFDLLRF